MGAHFPRNVLQQFFILQPGSLNASPEATTPEARSHASEGWPERSWVHDHAHFRAYFFSPASLARSLPASRASSSFLSVDLIPGL